MTLPQSYSLHHSRTCQHIDVCHKNLKDNIGEIINRVIITNTIMDSSDVKINLAKEILEGIYS